MIQEILLGRNSGLIPGGERNTAFSMNTNINIGSSNGGILLEATTTTNTVVVPRHHSSPSPSPSPSPTPSSSSAAEKRKSNDNNNNKLRCPRCDSPNTKFCYYNNYNLTQPRHFCKTCRRYWTKGGALRNVPIGGGCRKNKTSASPAVSVVPKLKLPAAEIGPGGGGFAGLDPFGLSQQQSPVLWGSPHLLALLRSATPNPNPSPSDPLSVKEEGSPFGGSHATQLSLWRSNKQPTTTTAGTQPSVQYGHQLGFRASDHHRSNGNSGIQELYQRLRSSSSSSPSPGNGTSFYTDDHQTAVVLTAAHRHAGSPAISSGGGGGGGEFGFWNNNSAFSWSDLQQTTAAATNSNGAYP